LITWNRAELPDSESLEIYADYSPVLRALGAVFGFGVLVAAAAPGMALAWRLTPRPMLLYGMLFAFQAAVAAFYVFARYRFPMVPILALFAGVTIVAIADAARAKLWPKPGLPVLGAAIAGVLVACLPPVVPAVGSRRLGYVNLGLGFAELGDRDAAATAFRTAIALAPRVAEPHHELAVVLEAAGRADEAVAELTAALALDPRYAAAHERLGTLLIKRGDLEGASRHLLTAYSIDPSRSSTPANLGTVASLQRRTDEAIGWYRKAIELAPENAQYHYRLSVVFANLDRRAEAETELEATLRLDPNNAGAHDDLGVLLARRGDLAGAAAHFREAYRIDPARPSSLTNLGGVAMSQGRFDEAAGWYRKALAADPDYATARLGLAQALDHLP
jgi:tetratricopeptide (TPR) repeat protein